MEELHMNKRLRICTLGEFSISYGNVTVSDQDNRSKKIWTLLKYLITFHSKEIPIPTLMDLLWPEDTSGIDPANALKTLLCRTRAVLDKLGYTQDHLIIRRRDTITWNNNIPFDLDCDEFERYCKLGASQDTDEDTRLSYFDKAFQLYKGNFLPKSAGETWAIPIITYYHSMYIKMIHEIILILEKKAKHEEIVRYCSFASTLDPYDEFIHYHLVLSLNKSGNPKAALEQYNHFLTRLYNDLGLNPSKDLSSLYKEIIHQNNDTELDLNVIEEDLIEPNAKPQAYLCDYAIFKNLYQIEARSIARSGISIFLCLITLDLKKYDMSDSLATAMNRMSKVIASNLRSGDVYSRYSVNQYIIMLPTANHENCIRIGNRILKAYNNIKPTISSITVSYNIKHIRPQKFQK